MSLRTSAATGSVHKYEHRRLLRQPKKVLTTKHTKHVVNPVTKQEVMRMIEAEGGSPFAAHEIRMTPSGFSGSLNGGVFVNVGGDPENGASWKYDMIFGPDGNLAFYLKGVESQAGIDNTKANR